MPELIEPRLLSADANKNKQIWPFFVLFVNLFVGNALSPLLALIFTTIYPIFLDRSIHFSFIYKASEYVKKP